MRETVEIMRYPVTLTPAPEGGYMVSFVDIPEALTQGHGRRSVMPRHPCDEIKEPLRKAILKQLGLS